MDEAQNFSLPGTVHIQQTSVENYYEIYVTWTKGQIEAREKEILAQGVKRYIPIAFKLDGEKAVELTYDQLKAVLICHKP